MSNYIDYPIVIKFAGLIQMCIIIIGYIMNWDAGSIDLQGRKECGQIIKHT